MYERNCRAPLVLEKRPVPRNRAGRYALTKGSDETPCATRWPRAPLVGQGTGRTGRECNGVIDTLLQSVGTYGQTVQSAHPSDN